MAKVLIGHAKDQAGHLLAGHGLSAGGVLAAYTVAGVLPSYVMDTENGIYYDGAYYKGPNQMHTHSTAGRRTIVDADGARKWSPHNIASRPDDFSAWVSTAFSGGTVPSVTLGVADPFGGNDAARVSFAAEVAPAQSSFQLSVAGVASGQLHTFAFWIRSTSGNISNLVVRRCNGETPLGVISPEWTLVSVSDNATASSGEIGFKNRPSVSGSGSAFEVEIARARFYESSLGGMQSTGDPADPTYVPASGSAVYWSGIDHDPSSGTPRGVLGEPQSTNLLVNTETLSTQGVTTSPQPYTLHFTGTGTVTLSGTSTAGPLVGTGTGEDNRVSLTFTPTAGTLTLTVTGTVTRAQLEAGSVATSYIPSGSSAATRAASNVFKPLSQISADLDEIVVVTEFECDRVAADAVIASLDNAGTDLIHFRAHTFQANLFVQDGGATQADVDAGAISAGTQYRAAFKMSANNFLASLGGATAVADTSGSMPTPTTLRLFNSNGAAPLAGMRIKKLIVYAGAAGSLDAIDATALQSA